MNTYRVDILGDIKAEGYRIKQQRDKFVVQKKFLWFFWKEVPNVHTELGCQILVAVLANQQELNKLKEAKK